MHFGIIEYILVARPQVHWNWPIRQNLSVANNGRHDRRREKGEVGGGGGGVGKIWSLCRSGDRRNFESNAIKKLNLKFHR